MRKIRSLLWVGSGRGLSRSGVTEAPELDVTWVPDLEEAARLPAVRFEAILVEATEKDRTEGVRDRLLRMGREAERLAPRGALLVALEHDGDPTEATDALLEAGATAVLCTRTTEAGTGLVSAVNEALDVFESRPEATSSLRAPTDGPAAASPAADSPDCSTPPRECSSRVPSAANGLSTPSEAMKAVSDLVDLAASSPSTVLITGETGVGKEVVARELHVRSERDGQPFVAINCAAFPETLLESELFGHARGAFTGADRAKEGLFRSAGRGTLFLDEIAETTLALQAKLLRVLQEREVRPVGDTTAEPIQCRIVAATNRILAEEVEKGRFREDLFYRLNVFPIRIPPLRDRRADILPLARLFLARHGPSEGKAGCHLSLAAGHLLEAYRWPGNVRELENEMLRALMLSSAGSLITPRKLSPKLIEILEPIAHGAKPDETLREALDRIESWLLRRALANNDGKKALTARKLGLTREGLYKKLKRLGIE